MLLSGDVAGLTSTALVVEVEGGWAPVEGFAAAVAAVKARCPSSFGSFPAAMVKGEVETLAKAL